MITVTRMQPDGQGGSNQTELRRYRARSEASLRRVVRDVCFQYDCEVSTPGARYVGYVLRPNNGAVWRLIVELRP